MRSPIAFLVLALFVACGNVSMDVAGGTGGIAGAADNGTGGAAGALEATGGRASGGAAGALDATGGRSIGGAAGALEATGGRDAQQMGTGGNSSAGSSGAGGAAAPRPCDGVCTDPHEITFSPSAGFNSGTLGSAAHCFETSSYFESGTCNSLDRTLSINGVPQVCAQGRWPSVPAAINGGWCILLAAGMDGGGFTLGLK